MPRERFATAPTVRRDLGEWRLAQRFPPFADTEEDGGSTPPAPTTPSVSRASGRYVPPMDWDRQRQVPRVGRALTCLIKMFTTRDDVRTGDLALAPSREPHSGCHRRRSVGPPRALSQDRPPPTARDGGGAPAFLGRSMVRCPYPASRGLAIGLVDQRTLHSFARSACGPGGGSPPGAARRR